MFEIIGYTIAGIIQGILYWQVLKRLRQLERVSEDNHYRVHSILACIRKLGETQKETYRKGA